MYTCIYCKCQYDKNTEHVFPLGLGGQNIIIDCVCNICNNEFSNIERELYQKSPVALIRSTEGIIGNKSRNTISAFKAPVLLSQDNITGIVYEVGQAEKMQVYVRPQVFQIKGVFYIETDLKDNLTAFAEKFKDWKSTNLRVILKFPETKLIPMEYLQIEKKDNNYFHKKVCSNLKKKNEIILDLFPKSHNLYKSLDPRIYLDDNRNLKIRARTEKEAVKFIIELLKFGDTRQIMTSSTPDTKNMQEVSVGFDFDSKKCEQALVKIALNILFYYFPSSREQNVIQPYIEFVKTGRRNFSACIEDKNLILDSIANTHNIFLYQCDSFLSLRISLFNGQFVYQFLIPDLYILKSGRCSRVVIDYKLNKNQIAHGIPFT